MLTQLITSHIFWSILAASLIAQGAKILVLIFKKKEKFQWSDLFVTGNMPSGHSALVTALTVSVLLTEGFSPLFFVSFVFAAVVIRDAVGVRRAVGEEGKVLSNIITVLKNRFHITIPRKMHQSLGHQPLEVFVGVLIGILSSVLMYGYFYFY
jgi:acid phosphatase family membrane protein YuiD